MASTAQASAPQGRESEGREQLLLAERYRLLPDRRLPQFDTSGGIAVAVGGPGNEAAQAYAILHHPGVPHRRDVVLTLLQAPLAGQINPLHQQIVRPAPDQPERLVTVIEMPGGPSLAEVAARQRVNGQVLRRSVIPGMVQSLAGLAARGLCHRALRPENIFFTGDDLEEIVTGDCFTAPPGADQPAWFESLERSTATPFGRGPGDSGCDIFAAGASLLMAHAGRDLVAGRDPERLLAGRIAQGSFWALSAGFEIPGIIGLLLRGMLNDDLDERWSLQDVVNWLESMAVNRRSVTTMWTFSRPVTFRRQSYADRRLLAREFGQQPVDAATFLRNQNFPQWIQSLVTSEFFSERLERLLDVRPDADLSSSRHGDHALVARVCAILDPLGPIRFRGLDVMLDGIGPAMAHAVATRDEKRIDAFRHLFDRGVLPAIMEIIGERNPVLAEHAHELTDTARLVTANEAGLLRATHDLNPSLPCLGDGVPGRWIASAEALLHEFEIRAGVDGEIRHLLDPYCLAFFASRVQGSRRHIEAIANAGTDRIRLMAAVVGLYAALQASLGSGALPRLCRHLAHGLKPAIEGLRSSSLRQQALERLDALARAGDLRRLSEELDPARLIALDRRDFMAARARSGELDRQRRRLLRPVQPGDDHARIAGYRFAAACGWLVMLATMAWLFATGGT